MAKRQIWKPDWSKAPKDTIGASFNADGQGWWWSVKPEIRATDKRPWDYKWRGPEYGQGYTEMTGVKVTGATRTLWELSWMDAPKT